MSGSNTVCLASSPPSPPVPDLTGVNSQYYHGADRYAAYFTGEQIFFDQTLYRQGLVLTPQGSATPWVYGVDWTVNTSDIDVNMTSIAVSLLPGFNKTLLKSVTILHPQADLPLYVDIASQSFYPRPESLPPIPAESNALTAMIADLLTRLQTVEAEVTQVATTTAGSPTTPLLLAWDIEEANSANLITAEPYQVNTFNGQNLIRPVNGSFFADSLVLSIAGRTLVLNTDYIPVGLNAAKTKRTSNQSGIYDLILLTTDYVGQVNVTYHAVGGEASVTDVSAIYQSLTDIRNFIDSSGFLNTNTLSTQPAIQNLLCRIATLENQMRILLSGTPNYGDTTNGTAITKFLRAADANLHWWTIASLYKVTGSPQIVQTDRMSLYLQLVGAMLTADIDITVDLRQTRDILTVNARNIVQDVAYTLYGTTGTPANVVVPQFRVIWNNDNPYVSGALLQIGLNLPNLTDTLAIEDRSGVESCWILDTNTGTVVNPLTPQDNTIVLPDSASTWEPGTVLTSTSATETMPTELGYLIWNGTQLLSSFDSRNGKYTFANVLPGWFRIQDITAVIAEIQDASNNPLRVVIPMTGVTANTRRGVGIVYPGSVGSLPVPMEVVLTTTGSVITVQAEVDVDMSAAPVNTLTYLIAYVGNSQVL